MAGLAHEPFALCNDATAQRATGQLFTDESTGYQYRYVQFKDAVTYAAGQICCWKVGTGLTSVTNDVSLAVGVIPAGVCLRVMTENYYGFVLVRGYYASLKTSGADDIAIGESLIAHATTDGTCDGVAAGSTTTASFGVAMTVDDDTANTVSGTVNIV